MKLFIAAGWRDALKNSSGMQDWISRSNMDPHIKQEPRDYRYPLFLSIAGNLVLTTGLKT